MAPIRIFLSYTRADEAQVKQLYHQLRAEGFTPWMDTEDLLPGQKFEYHIRQAIRDSDFFLACLSCNSVNRRGVIQKEINEALDVLQEKLDEDIYLIPVRLEACEVPERLRAFHWADLHADNGFDKLLRAIRSQIESQNFDAPAAHEGQVKSINGPAEWTEPTTGMEFVWIPPGRFLMGQTEAEKNWLIKEFGEERYKKYYLDELPRHEVQIREGFWMGKYPITQAQWLELMGKNSSYFKEKKVGAEWGRHPVENVSWDDCQEFVCKLNEQAKTPPPAPPQRRGESPSPSGRAGEGFRLPSEAEWEYACRAGSEGLFCFGNEVERLSDYAWYEKNSGSKTHPVGQLKPNAWGLYDMHGNVWEWCLDTWFDNYDDGPINERSRGILGDKKTKVMRGGSWRDGVRGLRCAVRLWYTSVFRNSNAGCRVAACGSGARTLR